MKTICVFAGSAKGSKDSYSINAEKLGFEIAKKNYSMVYGGGNNGLMGKVADAALKKGAKVTGIITQKLNDIEVGHENLTSLEIFPTMHQRKARMAEMSDAIISLPGGVGTWEEFFEAMAWNQLGIHSKPIILFDVEGYYSRLIDFMNFSLKEGFLPESSLDEILISDSLIEIFDFIDSFRKKDTQDWFNRLDR